MSERETRLQPESLWQFLPQMFSGILLSLLKGFDRNDQNVHAQTDGQDKSVFLSVFYISIDAQAVCGRDPAHGVRFLI